MTNQKTTKRALLSSVVALLLCFSMLLGTTYAWFTDSVTSTGNIIKTGTLDVEMLYADGAKDPATATWADASKEAIFSYDNWEPGYVDAKHLQIKNVGTLAFKYQMRILANGVISELADVIDVYYFADAVALDRADLTDAVRLGTLTEVLNVTYAKNVANSINGKLEAGATKTITLAFKMQEDAGNEYQNLSIGADFSVQILATQYTSESDSFDNTYDNGADFAPQETPAANVYALSQSKLQSITIGGTDGATLDTGYSFQPTETYEQALESEYSWAHADFFVYADATVPANSMALAGYYKAFDGFNFGGQTCSETNWIGLTSPDEVKAGKENGIRLIADGMNGGATNSGITIPYNTICEMGNDGTGFLCGAADLTGANEGTTLTVELRLYKTYPQGECPADHNGHSSKNCETGEYIVVGTFSYTFGGAYATLDDGSEVFLADDGDLILTDVSNVEAETYYVPDGVTAFNGGVFATNADITTVVVSDTVTDFGATGVSETGASSGAFKGSAVETVVLPEGMTEIPAAAFNGAKNLTSVNIPSTVDTIGVNAFRQTAITELTIPATVETISHGAFRDMTALTTVTIEGDVHIPDYAFRGCSALRTVYINGENATVGSNMAFANASSNNPGTNNIKFYVKNETVAAQVRACMGVGTDFWIYVDGVEVTVVESDAELLNAIKNPVDATSTTILLADGTYSADLKLTVEAIGQAQCENLIFKAAGNNVVFTGTTTLGYRNQGTGATMWNANVTFEGVTFDHANDATHSLDIQDVKSLTLKDCTIIGDGEYGITSARGNATGSSKIVGCTFENAGMQLLGNFATGLIIDDCTFNNSCINVQAGNGVTVQNCEFNATLTDANVDESFYMIRSNSTPITVKNCEINIDSELAEVVTTTQAKWYLLANRGTTNWTVENVAVTLTDAAVAQTQLKVTACTSTGVINTTNLTVNGVTQ